MPESSPCQVCRAGLTEWVAELQDEIDEYSRLAEARDALWSAFDLDPLTEEDEARLNHLERKFGYADPPNYGLTLRKLWPHIAGNPDRVCDTCGRHRLDVRDNYCSECGGTHRLDITP